MSASDDPQTLIAIADSRWDSIGGVVGGGLAGAFLAFFVSGINLLQALFDILIQPLGALGQGAGDVVAAIVGGAADIIEQGAQTTIATIAPGAQWAVGPLTFGFGILAAGGGLVVLGWMLSLEVTSNLIPFTFTDVPFFGVDEEDEQVSND